MENFKSSVIFPFETASLLVGAVLTRAIVRLNTMLKIPMNISFTLAKIPVASSEREILFEKATGKFLFG
ncbi:MAG: hypothetical protein AB8B69_14965 [Chitinophagales bacterium]